MLVDWEDCPENACGAGKERGTRVRAMRRVVFCGERCWSRIVGSGVVFEAAERVERSALRGCSFVDHLERTARRRGREMDSCVCMWVQNEEVGIANVAENGRLCRFEEDEGSREWRRVSRRFQRVRAADSAARMADSGEVAESGSEVKG